ncbi:MAG: hypothetical protein JNM95_01060 [Chitinophagaceae bacterium]|nr:hypothetical protein [Chitinophagaceae bacterium]
MKKFLLLLLICSSIGKLQAQFQCDLGVSYAGSSTNTQTFMRPYTIWGTSIRDTNYYSYQVHASGYGVTVYPKFHVVQANDLTISLGAPVMIGLGGSSSSKMGSTLNYIYDLNFCVDINGGRLNRRQDYPDKPLGFFLGVGFGLLNTSGIQYSGDLDNSLDANSRNITYVPEGGYFDEFMTAKSSGLMLHGGIVAPMFKKESKKSIGLRVFLKPGFGGKQLTYYGIGTIISFSSDRGY